MVDANFYYTNKVTAMKMPECVTDDRLRDGMKKAGRNCLRRSGTAQGQDLQDRPHGRRLQWRLIASHSDTGAGSGQGKPATRAGRGSGGRGKVAGIDNGLSELYIIVHFSIDSSQLKLIRSDYDTQYNNFIYLRSSKCLLH